CCQFVDPARLSRELGQAALLDLLQHLIQEASDEVAKYEGSVTAVLGDGIVALFGVPLAQEDHARRAVLSALGIQRRLNHPLGPEVRPRAAPGFRLGEQVRMGLHTGWLAFAQVGTTDQERTAAIGEATAVASAIQQAAESGRIAISDATARLVAGFARLEALDAGGVARTPIYRLI